MYWIRHIQNSGKLRTLFIQVHAGIFKLVQHYKGIVTHNETLLRNIQAYSGIFSTLALSQPCHIPSPGIFRTRDIFKPCETLTRPFKDPAIVRTVYSVIIQPYSDIFSTLCNACICRKLAYSECWTIRNPSIIASRRIFRTVSYLRK